MGTLRHVARVVRLADDRRPVTAAAWRGTIDEGPPFAWLGAERLWQR
jgi:hypothetical protein